MIELKQLKLIPKNTLIYYHSDELEVYRKRNSIIIKKDDITQVNQIKEISDFRTVYTENEVFILFGGKQLLRIGKDHSITPIKFNPIVTKVKSIGNNIVFGWMLGRLFHFSVCNPYTGERIYQTKSFQSKTLSYKFTNSNIYSLMGNSNIICYDYECKQIWQRFEHQYTVPGLAIYKNKLVYCSSNQIKITNGKEIETIQIPIVTIDKIEDIIGNKLYCICGKKKNICCYDLQQKQLLYEIRGNQNILNLKIVKMKHNNQEIDALVYTTENMINIANLKKGTLVISQPIVKIKEIVEEKDIILRTYSGGSFIFSENQEVENESNSSLITI